VAFIFARIVLLGPLEHLGHCLLVLRVKVGLFCVARDVNSVNLLEQKFKFALWHLIIDRDWAGACRLQEVCMGRLKVLGEVLVLFAVIKFGVVVPFWWERLRQHSNNWAV